MPTAITIYTQHISFCTSVVIMNIMTGYLNHNCKIVLNANIQNYNEVIINDCRL